MSAPGEDPETDPAEAAETWTWLAKRVRQTAGEIRRLARLADLLERAGLDPEVLARFRAELEDLRRQNGRDFLMNEIVAPALNRQVEAFFEKNVSNYAALILEKAAEAAPKADPETLARVRELEAQLDQLVRAGLPDDALVRRRRLLEELKRRADPLAFLRAACEAGAEAVSEALGEQARKLIRDVALGAEAAIAAGAELAEQDAAEEAEARAGATKPEPAPRTGMQTAKEAEPAAPNETDDQAEAGETNEKREPPENPKTAEGPAPRPTATPRPAPEKAETPEDPPPGPAWAFGLNPDGAGPPELPEAAAEARERLTRKARELAARRNAPARPAAKRPRLRDAAPAERARLPDLKERLPELMKHLRPKPARRVSIFVMYDISDNRLRTELFEFLKSKGLSWIQYSLFMGELPREQYELLCGALDELREAYDEQDSVVVLPVTDADLRGLQVFGRELDVADALRREHTMFF